MMLIDEIITSISNTLNVKTIVIFGNQLSTAVDIDLLIVSDDFCGVSELKRQQILKTIDEIIDPICFTESEFCLFKNDAGLLFRKIKKTGKVLYGNKELIN